MKYLYLAAALFFASCNSTTTSSKSTKKQDTLMMMGLYTADLKNPTLVGGIIKRVTNYPIRYTGVDGEDSTIRDTVYLIPTVDSTLVVLDSLKRPILDKGQMQYQGSFRKPFIINKAYVQPTTIVFPFAK